MKVEYINPFIEATYDLFSTMLASKAVRGNVAVAKDQPNPQEMMGLIGLSGRARGMVALAFPTETALAMVNRLLSSDLQAPDDTVSDAIAEMVNIVAGGAKAKMNVDGRAPIDLSLPTVVRGSSFNVEYPSSSVWIEVPFDSELGAFRLRVTLEVDN